jgi:antitoxin component of RelBE/YafQ-DinJ toxin-antitoxin module
MANLKKVEYLHIRISPEVKDAAEKRAEATGVKLSEYVRLLILEDSRSARKEGSEQP